MSGATIDASVVRRRLVALGFLSGVELRGLTGHFARMATQRPCVAGSEQCKPEPFEQEVLEPAPLFDMRRWAFVVSSLFTSLKPSQQQFPLLPSPPRNVALGTADILFRENLTPKRTPCWKPSF